MFNGACSLPTVKPRMAPDFARGQTRVRSVAILPVDISVQMQGANNVARPDLELEDQVMNRIQRGVAASLRRRGFHVASTLDARGVGARGQHRAMVIHPTDLAALRVEIHRSTSYQASGPGVIHASVTADLTRQIQAATGADASIYARGWIYVGREQSASLTALKIIGMTLMIVLVVGLMVAMFAGGKGSKSKGKRSSGRHFARGRRSSGAGRAFAHAAGAMVRAAAAVGEVVIHTAPRPPVDGGPCHTCEAPPAPPPSDLDALDDLDDPGLPPPARPAPPVSATTHEAQTPAPSIMLHDEGRVPERSTIGLAISLVQNSSGRVLWHGKQDFQVKVDGSYNVERLIEHFFQGLPDAR